MAPPQLAPKLTKQELEKNFSDIAPAMTRDEAAAEANRCLYCYDAPCMHACPTHIDVPEFIKQIATGNPVGSAKTIFDANMLGASCARACPTEMLCAGACVMHHQHMPPIQIGRLQRYSTDYVIDRRVVLYKAGPPTGKKVGVIGAGPAGLACAAELALLGHKVVVYESKEKAGGLNAYGIAPYKLTNEAADKEVAYIQKIGMTIKTNAPVGTKSLPLAKLEAEHDALFLGVGLGNTTAMRVPGEELEGVIGATEFIEHLRRHPISTRVGRRVAVIGAGNTAIDAATEAKRLGAEVVYLIYRRGEDEKPCYELEFQLAKTDGCVFLWYAAPVRIEGKGSVERLVCQRTRPGKPDASGRPAPEPVPDSEFVLDVDMVIKSTGQSKHIEFFNMIKGVKMERGRVVVNDRGQTGNPKYFAAGDCVNGGKEVVWSAAQGKAAAHGIHEYLMGIRPDGHDRHHDAYSTRSDGTAAPARGPAVAARPAKKAAAKRRSAGNGSAKTKIKRRVRAR